MRRRWWLTGASLAVVGLTCAVGGVTVVERHDPACALCHLPPEATFVARAAGPASDLASKHARPMEGAPVHCVDCHGGPGVSGRLASWRIGADDLWQWVRGDYTVLGTSYLPADSLRHPVDDGTCLACHADVMADTGFANHFHTKLADPGRAAPLGCIGCHAAHASREPAATDGGLSPALALQCEACHRELGGPLGLAEATPAPAKR